MNPSRADLVAHARRYGTDLVAESAAEYMGVTELAALIAQLDVIDRERAAARRYSGKPKRLRSPEVRARRLLGIEDEEVGSGA